VLPLDAAVMSAAAERQGELTKPAGALGQLESLSVRLAGITGVCPPSVPARPAVAVFAGDHGVVRSGVTPWPQEVTAQMVANFLTGGAAVNVLARQVGAEVIVVDVGVATPIPPIASERLRSRNVRLGTDDLAVGPAMSRANAEAAVLVGLSIAQDLVDAGHDLLVTGEMGIGNTTPSAALIAAITGLPAADCTGRGTGVNDETLALKTAVIDRAVARCRDLSDGIDLLAEIGGLEIAALAGFIIGGAAAGVPVIVDGVITLAALLVAEQLAPGVSEHVIAGHRSTEPGASIVLDKLGLEPLLDLGLRLGEGSGAVLAIGIVQAAAAILNDMATFNEAGIA
jgi:nicotinate-nucleotide--dimethylbenzimidazole phosphoribosyltransferase